jgi:serine/threonine protein kinase
MTAFFLLCTDLAPQILHLDIAPSNILLSPEGHALLIDFHISKKVQDVWVFDARAGRQAFLALARLDGMTPMLSGLWATWVCKKGWIWMTYMSHTMYILPLTRVYTPHYTVAYADPSCHP